MKNLDKSFLNSFCEDDQLVISLVQSKGFSLTLVGGATRQFLKERTLPGDLDFEISYSEVLEEEAWKNKLKKLKEELSNRYAVEFLPYGIIRLTTSRSVLEFSSPRVEEFDEQLDQYSHKDFCARLFSNLDSAKAFKRRDFTINAIGIDLQSLEIVDPFDGMKDLAENTLNCCDDDFVKDPVRFLRLIRFRCLLAAKISDRTKKLLTKFNLKKVTNHYFFQEGFKCDFYNYVVEFFSFVRKFDIEIPQALEEISFIEKMSKPLDALKNREDVLGWLINDPQNNFSKEELILFCSYSQIKKSAIKRLQKKR